MDHSKPNSKKSKMNRRSFFKKSSAALAAGGVGLMISNKANALCHLSCSIDKYDSKDVTKFLNPDANVADLTVSARKMLSRDRLLGHLLEKIPTPERVEQVFNIVAKHLDAEERRHVQDTMATLDPNPIFESVPEGIIYETHEDVQKDYEIRYDGLTRKLHVTNMVVDSSGAFAEVLWEGQQVSSYKGYAPAKNAKRFFLPMVIYYEVTQQGLIKRESVYYDYYTGLLSLEMIPHIIKEPLTMVQLNNDLVMRKLKGGK
jgi:hypothetical protein